MVKPEWGTKRICPSCGARYYDLHKQPPICPVCGTMFDPELLLRSRRARPAPVEEPVKKAAPPPTEDELGIEIEEDEAISVDDGDDVPEDTGGDDSGDDEEDVLIEDASELGEDVDMGDVVDVDGEEQETP